MSKRVYQRSKNISIAINGGYCLNRNRLKTTIRLQRPKMKLSASNSVQMAFEGQTVLYIREYCKIINHQRSIIRTERDTKHDKVGWKGRNGMEEEC